MKLDPTTGSPPMPTIVELPSGLGQLVADLVIASVPDRLTEPIRPSRKISAGMIPTFAFPGESAPGRTGPSIVMPFGRM